MNTTETEQETPILSHAHIFKTDDFTRGYIKCRLFHLEGGSIVVPDVLMVNNLDKHFFSPQFFTASLIYCNDHDSDGSCFFVIDIIEGVRIKMLFFRHDLVKQCADHSFIYKCAFVSADGNPLPEPHGTWRKRGDQFELALYHHTDKDGADGIQSSKEIWGSEWNIQGIIELKNIAYGYFTSIPKIKNTVDLNAIGMSPEGKIGLIPTNAPLDLAYAYELEIRRKTATISDIPLEFWVDVEVISPSHLWRHTPLSPPNNYERVLPKVFRVGVQPKRNLPLKGMMLDLKSDVYKIFDYIIVGDANTKEGLMAPFYEEETKEICKLDTDPDGLEIIGMWCKKKNSDLFTGRDVELAELTSTPSAD